MSTMRIFYSHVLNIQDIQQKWTNFAQIDGRESSKTKNLTEAIYDNEMGINIALIDRRDPENKILAEALEHNEMGINIAMGIDHRDPENKNLAEALEDNEMGIDISLIDHEDIDLKGLSHLVLNQ